MRAHLAIVIMGAAIGLASVAGAKDPEPAVKFPTGYRQWTHTKSMAIVSDRHPLFTTFGGIHHIYVNDVGLKAAKAHGTYPDGAVIVFDLLEWNEAEGAYTEGARKLVAVMHKDSKRFKDTGGWGFEGFKAGDPKQRVVTDAANQCFNCHAAQKEHDAVFSQYRE